MMGRPEPPEVLTRPHEPAVERLAYRLDELAEALGVSRRTIERQRSAGRFPKPDRTIGRMPLWSRQTLERWLAEGGGQS